MCVHNQAPIDVTGTAYEHIVVVKGDNKTGQGNKRGQKSKNIDGRYVDVDEDDIGGGCIRVGRSSDRNAKFGLETHKNFEYLTFIFCDFEPSLFLNWQFS